MNLIKSFNLKYLKEIIKEGKGIVIFSIIINPVLISLILFTINSSSSSITAVSLSDIAVVNILLMYVIPLVFSNLFFGFIYKRKSTDFMLSMPVNRKTIFVTGIIGGIFLILVLQVLTAVVTFIGSAIFENVYIPTKEILDCFIMMLISYIFVFSITSLATTFSGNIIGQIVASVVIAFLVPVMVDCFSVIAEEDYYYKYDDYYNLTITNGEEEIDAYEITQTKGYTMPYRFLRYGYEYCYSNVSLIKMVVLAVIYFVIGLKLFEIRKMENNNGSYTSVGLHLIIKALTVLPILLFINMIFSYDPDDIEFYMYVIVFVILAIYYFVYDYIVRKKVPLSLGILSFLATIIVLEIGILGVRTMYSNAFYAKEFDVSDIKGISLGSSSNGNSISSYFNENAYVYDEYLISEIFDNSANWSNQFSSYLKGDSESGVWIQFKVKLKFGKTYEVNLYIYESAYEEIQDYLKTCDWYKEKVESTLTQSGKISYNGEFLDSKTTKEVDKLIEESIDEIVEYDLDDDIQNSYIPVFTKYIYMNHELKEIEIPIISDELVELFAEKGISALRKYLESNNTAYTYYVYDNDYDYLGTIESSYVAESFLEDDIEKSFSPNKSYVMISFRYYTSSGYVRVSYFTNSVTKVKNMVN